MVEYEFMEVKKVVKKISSKDKDDQETTHTAILENDKGVKIRISSPTPLSFIPKTSGLTVKINNPQTTL